MKAHLLLAHELTISIFILGIPHICWGLSEYHIRGPHFHILGALGHYIPHEILFCVGWCKFLISFSKYYKTRVISMLHWSKPSDPLQQSFGQVHIASAFSHTYHVEEVMYIDNDKELMLSLKIIAIILDLRL